CLCPTSRGSHKVCGHDCQWTQRRGDRDMKSTWVMLSACGLSTILGSTLTLLRAGEPRPGPREPVSRPVAAPPAAATFRARDVLGMSVRNPDGQPVGEVDDLVIDANGQVLYAVLAYQALQNQEQLVIMPWTILQAQYGP